MAIVGLKAGGPLSFLIMMERQGIDGESGSKTHIKALLTSPIGITPSFSVFRGSANSPNTSRISDSCDAEMLFSRASLERLSPPRLAEAALFGGYLSLQRLVIEAALVLAVLFFFFLMRGENSSEFFLYLESKDTYHFVEGGAEDVATVGSKSEGDEIGTVLICERQNRLKE